MNISGYPTFSGSTAKAPAGNPIRFGVAQTHAGDWFYHTFQPNNPKTWGAYDSIQKYPHWFTTMRAKKALKGEHVQRFNKLKASIDARGETLDLQGVNLSGKNLAGVNFKGVKTGERFLNYTSFQNANLRGADLRGMIADSYVQSVSQFKGADLRDANLSGTDLTGYKLHKTNLRGANLSGATINSTMNGRLSHASLEGANLEGAKISRNLITDLYEDGDRIENVRTWGGSLSKETVQRYVKLRKEIEADLKSRGAELSGQYTGESDLLDLTKIPLNHDDY